MIICGRCKKHYRKPLKNIMMCKITSSIILALWLAVFCCENIVTIVCGGIFLSIATYGLFRIYGAKKIYRELSRFWDILD